MRKSFARNIVDLHAHSTYSVQDGFGSPEDVVLRAKELGQTAACLTEHGNLSSAPSFYQACRANGIKPILGCEMYVVPDQILGVHEKEYRSASRHLTVLALSKEGYHNLVRWSSFSMERSQFYNKPRISLDAMAEIAPHPLHHNVVLSGCLGSEINQTILSENGNAFEAGLFYIESICELFPNFFIELQGHRHSKFYKKGFTAYDGMVDAQDAVRETLRALAQATGTSTVLTNDSHYQSADQRRAHMALLANKGWRSKSTEVHHSGSTEQQIVGFAKDYSYYLAYLQDMEGIAERLGLDQEPIDSIRDIVEEADIRLDPLDGIGGISIPHSGHDDPIDEIRRRSKTILKRLVAKHGPEVKDRFDYELTVMADFGHYLMLTANILHEARESGILTWTRGSAANSLVCYCLKIHDIDPIEFHLPFERFMNPTRVKPPDIDIDIASTRREDFVRIIAEQMEKNEGEGMILPICTYGTVANRSAFKLAAEALGMEKERIEDLSKLLPQMSDSGFASEDEVYSVLKEEFPELVSMAGKSFKQIRNYSKHAAAVLLGTKGKPIADWIPAMLISSSNSTVTQYDMHDLEQFGFVKFDALVLDSLDIVANALRMAGRDPFEIHTLPLDDAKAYEILQKGHTEGVHSMQGKTQRRGCMEVRPENVHDVVAIQALYRAGGTRSGFDKLFVKRRRGEVEWASPTGTESILDETYGLPIFQEQILDLGKALGATEAENQDLLGAIKKAKGVGEGAREEFERLRAIYSVYAKKIMEEDAFDELWKLIETAAGYMFNRGHASSYAVLAVRMALIRAIHPQEFFSALLDAYPQNAQYLSAAQAEGFSFLAPDINESGSGFSRGHNDRTIRVGLSRIKGVGPSVVNSILRGQPFHSSTDFRERTPTNVVKAPQVEALRSVGAFREVGVLGDDDDFSQFRHLGFCLGRPRVFKGIKPKLSSKKSGTWAFSGLQSDTRLTEGKSFCAKLFWIPPLEDKELLKLKASPWALAKSYLLTAVDVNGIPFELAATEKKDSESKILQLLAKFGKGAVVCVEGQLKGPFQRGHPNMFTVWGVAGGDEPLIWNAEDDRLLEWIAALNRAKKLQRRSAA